MCGIVGLIFKEDKNNNEINRVLDKMLNIIYHRGPDGEGRYINKSIGLGMRRLAIIDIEKGSQPFISEDKEIIVFQNGEIYNYIELKNKLKNKGYIFKTDCDTEVILNGYKEWDINLFEKLDGMFAISILDKRKNKLILARDRFGEKPLYYYRDENIFIYSSDLRAILETGYIKNISYDYNSLSRYLMLGFTILKDSIIKDIKKLLPSFFMEIDVKTFQTKETCYYVPLLESKEYNNPKDTLKDILNRVIDLRLRADVNVGVFLSGGVDSSLIATLSAKIKPRIDTFSIGFKSIKHDESKYAKKVASYIKSNHHHFIFEEENFMDLLPQVVKCLDEPLGDQAILPTYWLSKEARKYVKVVLSGEGADEIFGGYGYFKKDRIPKKLIYNDDFETSSGFPLLINKNFIKNILNGDFEEETLEEKYLWEWLKSGENNLQVAMASDLKTWLPDDLLVKLDRMTMANSLEGRAPYLSYEVVNFSYSLNNDKFWINNNINKYILREVAKEYLPKEIFKRPKQGFVLPMDEWIKNFLKKNGIQNFFYKREIPEINTKLLVNHVKKELNYKTFNQRFIYSLIILYLWNDIILKKYRK